MILKIQITKTRKDENTKKSDQNTKYSPFSHENLPPIVGSVFRAFVLSCFRDSNLNLIPARPRQAIRGSILTNRVVHPAASRAVHAACITASAGYNAHDSLLGWVGGLAMSLTEVLPEVQMLSRLDKIRLIQLLAQELERDEDDLIEPGRSYPVWSPDRAFSAAAALLQALEDEKDNP
jgi:hypothetical protein